MTNVFLGVYVACATVTAFFCFVFSDALPGTTRDADFVIAVLLVLVAPLTIVSTICIVVCMLVEKTYFGAVDLKYQLFPKKPAPVASELPEMRVVDRGDS